VTIFSRSTTPRLAGGHFVPEAVVAPGPNNPHVTAANFIFAQCDAVIHVMEVILGRVRERHCIAPYESRFVLDVPRADRKSPVIPRGATEGEQRKDSSARTAAPNNNPSLRPIFRTAILSPPYMHSVEDLVTGRFDMRCIVRRLPRFRQFFANARKLRLRLAVFRISARSRSTASCRNIPFQDKA
jgi:hypothetical protein